MAFNILKFKKIPSTQTKLKELIKKGKAKEGTVILAQEQTSGYGRLKRSWYSPPGGLYFSVCLPKLTIDDLQTLTFLAGMVVAKIIKEKFSLEPFLKLPNDVYLSGKKVCGILTENLIKGKDVLFSIMGIGLNTNIDKFPEDLANYVTSLKIELGKNIDNEEMLKEILNGLKNQFEIISQ